jgi:hypothetical protein
VGVGLPAIGPYRSTSMLTVPAPSRASPLPQGFMVLFKLCSPTKGQLNLMELFLWAHGSIA